MTTRTVHQTAALPSDSAFLTIMPFNRAGQRLPALTLEHQVFWCLNSQRLELVGPCLLTNGKRAVQLRTSEQDLFVSGYDYWKMIHGERRITREDAGILAARLHQWGNIPPSFLLDDPESMWCSKEPVPRSERNMA